MDNEKKLKYIAYFGGLSVNPWEDIPKNFAEDQENQFSGIQEICQKHKISCDELVILSDNAMFQDVR